MADYGVYEAKTKLAELIRQVRQGKRVTITHRGEPIADLVPSTRRAREQVQDAIDAIKRMRAGSIDQARFAEMRLRGRR